jgi:hypothetical protein
MVTFFRVFEFFVGEAFSTELLGAFAGGAMTFTTRVFIFFRPILF